MLELPEITGEIKKVGKDSYDQIIHNYVEKVKHLPGVVSIIGMGSVTAPGLSDIDIIVVVDDNNPPDWRDISIVELSRGMEGEEVVFHDVFVIPEKIADYIEGFFYLDRVIVYYGNPIGGNLTPELVERLRMVITFDYCIHRIDSFFRIQQMNKVEMRTILLFISTFRHTYKLLMDLRVLSPNEAKLFTNEIELLRKRAIEGGDIEGLIQITLEKGIESLYKAVKQLSVSFGYSIVHRNIWVLGIKKLIIPSDWSNYLTSNLFARRFIVYLPYAIYPYETYAHVKSYETYMALSSKLNNQEVIGDSIKQLMQFRTNLVLEHWNFIERNGYAKSSGHGYIITPRPAVRTVKSVLKFYALQINSLGLNILRNVFY